MNKLLKWLAPVVVGLAAISSAYGLVTLPYTFTAGQAIEAAKVNANDQALRDGINTHLTATNPHNTTLSQVLAVGNSAGVNAINFNGVPSQNFLVQNVTTDPSCGGAQTGELIYNTIDNLFKICNGTSFVSIAGTGVNTLASVLSAGNSASTFNIDLNSNQILNQVIENRTTDGGSVAAGRIFFRTNTSELKVCDGTSCTALGGAQGLASVLGTSNSAGSVDLDLNGQQLLHARMEVLASDPATTYTGRIYYNSSSNIFKFYNGSAWVSVGNTQGLSDVMTIGNSVGSTNLDVNEQQLLHARVENLSGTPGTGNAGRLYYDTTATKLMYAESSVNRAVVSEDKTQTLTNKSISGGANTITNVPDSALSANVDLLNADQSVSGKKSFATGKISVADISTPSGGKHILTDGLANDTITLNNAVQTLTGKTLGATSVTGNLNLTENQLVNARVENRGADPTPGNKGRIFFKTATGELAYDDGTNIRVLTASNNGSSTPWDLGGNSLIDDTVDFFGTTDSEDVVMISGSTNLLTLSKTGHVVTPTLTSGLLHADGTGVLSSSKVVDADISSIAAIDASKIADGSVSSTEFQYLDGASSNIQSQLTALSGSQITSLTGDVVAAGPGAAASTIQAGVVTNAKIASAAGISVNKLAAQTASRALVSDASGFITPATTTSTEIGYVNGVTSSIQTQFAAKQPLDSDLTSIAALSATGIAAQTAVGTWANRTITGTANTITMTNGDGVSGNPTVTIAANPILPGTGSVTVPIGATATRPGSPVNGMFRYNSDNNQFEGYAANNWGAIAGSGGGGINYITASDGASLGAWTTYDMSQTATMTIASPTVVTVTSTTGFYPGMPLSFSTTGATPSGVLTNSFYFVSTVVSGTTFQITNTVGGAAIAATGSQSGVHTFHPGVPLVGTGGSPTLTFTAGGGSELVGANRFAWTRPASLSMGQGASYDFTIDAAFESKPLTLTAQVLTDTHCVDNDMDVWVYDKANFVPIQPTPYHVKCSLAPQTIKMEFPSNYASNAYRLELHSSGVSTTSSLIIIDEIKVSPNTYTMGASVTPIAPYVPTVTGMGTTVTGMSEDMYRDGGYLIGHASWVTGTPGTLASFSLPNGLTIDPARVTAATTTSQNGPLYGQWQAAGSAQFGGIVVAVSTNANLLYFSATSGSSQMVPQSGTSIVGTGALISINFRVPIQGWGYAQIQSSDTDGRQVQASYFSSSTGTTLAAGAIVNFDSKIYDSHNAVTTGSSWRFTAPYASTYSVKEFCYFGSGSGFYFILFKNGVNYQYGGPFTSTTQMASLVGDVKLNSGEYFDIRSTGGTYAGNGASAPYECKIDILSSNNSTQIAASEAIHAQYMGNGGTALTADVTNVDFATKVTDDHGAWDGTTYHSQRAGWCDFKGSVLFSSSSGRNIFYWVNNTKGLNMNSSLSTNLASINGGTYLKSGDVVNFRSDTGATLSNSVPSTHWISITCQ